MTNRTLPKLTWPIAAITATLALALAVTRLLGLWPEAWILCELTLKAVLQ